MERLIEAEILKREKIVKSFNKNYLLEAGAGAGKTTIIVERVINHIIDGSIEPQNIVAITFTKAASLELAQRIQRKALDYLGDERYFYAKEKLERVEEIFTGTIHSFCELLLREMPFEAGLTPGYEIVEDTEEFYSKIWYEFLREFEEESKTDMRNLNKFNIDYRQLKQSAFVAMDNPDIDFVGFKDEFDFKSLEEKFQAIDTDSLNSSFIKTGSNLGKLCIRIIEDKRDLNYYIDNLLTECTKTSKDEDLATKFIYKKHLEAEGVDKVIGFIETLIDIADNLNSIMYNICTDFINRVVYYKNTTYTNSLTFNDLLFRASNLIKKSSKAREHFKNKFKCFYIDEAQDTDPMQAELLLLLGHDGDIKDLNTIEDVSPRQGSLFIVGDPKQSIYRFRRADITIYESVKRIIEKNGEVVYLDINFRSSDSICSWVEGSFKNREDGFAFTEKASLVQAGFEKILSLWKDKKEIEEEKNKLSGVYGYGFSEDMEFSEEEYISAIVEDMIQNSYIDEKVNKEDIKTRKIENKDIMILTKSNEETGRYLSALKERNIPALLAGEKRLGETREVLNLFLLIDFIIDFKDKIKFVSALRNSFYLELETINYLLKEYNYEDIIVDEEKIKGIKHPHLKEALFYIRKMFVESKLLKPINFIETLIKERNGIYEIYRDYKEIEKRDADSSLIQTLEILKSKRPMSLYEVREELKVIIEEKVNYELPIDLDFSQNAVRIMNIHKAKGLEASVVILVGSDKKRTLGGDSHYVDKIDDKTEGYLVYKKSLLVSSPEETRRKEREKLFKDAELDRLIYVAATRAKSVLITPFIEDEKLFLSPLSNGFKRIIDSPKIENKYKDNELTQRKLEEISITNELLKKREVSKKSYEKESPSTMEEFKEDHENEELIIDRTTPRGTIYGSIVHRAFEIMFRNSLDFKNILKKDIDYAINRSINETIDIIHLEEKVLKGLYPNNTFNLDIKDIEEVKGEVKSNLYENLYSLINSFLSNESIIELFSNARRIFTEFPFTAAVDSCRLKSFETIKKDYKSEKIILNGFIDLLIQLEENIFVIIDYKTDIIAENLSIQKFKEKYTTQLKLYKLVLEDKKINVENLLVYSTYLKKLVSLEEVALK